MQAKANEAKYTGVSSDDLRSGGFGAKSSTGFGSGSLGTLSAGSSTKYRAGDGLGGSGFGSDSRSTLYDEYDEPSRSTDVDKVLLTPPMLAISGPIDLQDSSTCTLRCLLLVHKLSPRLHNVTPVWLIGLAMQLCHRFELYCTCVLLMLRLTGTEGSKGGDTRAHRAAEAGGRRRPR